MIARNVVFEFFARQTPPATLHAQCRTIAIAADTDLEIVLACDQSIP
jgi:hypothetical protein